MALRTLGIAPALQGEIWPVPLGVRMNEGDGSAFEFRPPGTLRAVMFIGRLWRDYRPLDVAIRDARRDLRERGVRLLSDDSARE